MSWHAGLSRGQSGAPGRTVRTYCFLSRHSVWRLDACTDTNAHEHIAPCTIGGNARAMPGRAARTIWRREAPGNAARCCSDKAIRASGNAIARRFAAPTDTLRPSENKFVPSSAGSCLGDVLSSSRNSSMAAHHRRRRCARVSARDNNAQDVESAPSGSKERLSDRRAPTLRAASCEAPAAYASSTRQRGAQRKG